MTRRRVLATVAAAWIVALLPVHATAEDRQRSYVVEVAGMT